MENIDKVIALTNAGFSKDEIMRLMNIEPVQNPSQVQEQEEPKPTQVEEPKPTPMEEPKPTQTEEQKPAQTLDKSDEIIQALAKLTSTIQANAIATSLQPQARSQEDAESIMASIIRPQFGGDKK